MKIILMVLSDRPLFGRSTSCHSSIQIDELIGLVFYTLLARNVFARSAEEEMVFEALRRSKASLADATESELSDYLTAKTPEELQGVASNVKGLYHEIKYVADYNRNHDTTFARLMEETNHPGYDVEIIEGESGGGFGDLSIKGNRQYT